jgi:hypothetical protein
MCWIASESAIAFACDVRDWLPTRIVRGSDWDEKTVWAQHRLLHHGKAKEMTTAECPLMQQRLPSASLVGCAPAIPSAAALAEKTLYSRLVASLGGVCWLGFYWELPRRIKASMEGEGLEGGGTGRGCSRALRGGYHEATTRLDAGHGNAPTSRVRQEYLSVLWPSVCLVVFVVLLLMMLLLMSLKSGPMTGLD